MTATVDSSGPAASNVNIQSASTQNISDIGRVTQIATTKKIGPLSFQSTTYSKRGRYLERCHFDVPLEDYSAGWQTGMKAAKELMEAMKANPVQDYLSPIDLLGILQSASNALGEKTEGPSRRGAAAGFLRMVETMLGFSAEHANHQDYIQARIERQAAITKGAMVRLSEEKEARRQAFVSRMAEARLAKKAGQADKA